MVMIARVGAMAVIGIDTVPVTVEVALSNGLPGLTVVGLPDKSVAESRERVRSAIRASGAVLPPQRITVNLAPADLKKEGPAFDLSIAVGILAAAEQVPPPPAQSLFLGELSLNGALRPVRGVLPVAAGAADFGVTSLFVPADNAAEAALPGNLEVIPVPSLQALVDHLKNERMLSPFSGLAPKVSPPAEVMDLADIRGQNQAKRALEIAAAGAHNLLLSGPPGTGKTLLAQALPGILPGLDRAETLEVTKIYSVAGLLPPDRPLVTERPFRNPHHSISLAGLVGGGSWPRPGELSLAHRGVLYLDEIPQFPGYVLEAIRCQSKSLPLRFCR